MRKTKVFEKKKLNFQICTLVLMLFSLNCSPTVRRLDGHPWRDRRDGFDALVLWQFLALLCPEQPIGSPVPMPEVHLEGELLVCAHILHSAGLIFKFTTWKIMQKNYFDFFVYFQFSDSQFTRQIRWNQINPIESWKSLDVVLGSDKEFTITLTQAHGPRHGAAYQCLVMSVTSISYPGATSKTIT